MTCIVGISDGKNVTLGGDAAASSATDRELYTLRTEKVFAAGEYLVGYCASYRAGQIAQYQVEWPTPPEEKDADLCRFVVNAVVPVLCKALGGGPTHPGQFLIGLRGHLFSIANDFSATELEETWIAIGSGRMPAYGALYAMEDSQLDPKTKARRALEAAERYTNNVRRPFVVISSQS
jgi:hypothetical protein